MVKQQILVIEDEEDLRADTLQPGQGGYRVTGVTSAEEARQVMRVNPTDLILLDLMLPGMDGTKLCRLVKQDPALNSIPVIMLTAKSEESDVILGLELGADDYVAKPFSPRILLARVRAMLRRQVAPPQDDTSQLTVHNIRIHPGRHEVTVEGQPDRADAHRIPRTSPARAPSRLGIHALPDRGCRARRGLCGHRTLGGCPYRRPAEKARCRRPILLKPCAVSATASRSSHAQETAALAIISFISCSSRWSR